MQTGASHRTKLLSLFLALVTVLSVVAGGASAGGTFADGADVESVVTEPTSEGAPPPAAQFQSNELETVDNISVWERAVLPLRTDTTASGVRTTLEAPDTLRAKTVDANFDLHKDRFAVYEASESIPIEFDGTRALKGDSLLTGEEVQLLAVRLKQGAETPTEVSDLPDLLESRNTTAKVVSERTFGDSSYGPFTFTHTPGQGNSGTYVYMLSIADVGSGFMESGSGNVSVGDNEVTIVGADVAAVQESSSTVEPQPGRQDVVPRGGNATFDVDASPLGPDVDHTVVLINETDLQERRAVVNLTPSPTVLETNIQGFEGASEVESGTNVLGVRDTGSSSISGFVTLRDIVTSVDSGLEGDNLDVEYVAGATPVDASITSVQGTTADEVTVGTSDLWAPGEYRWIHIATEHDGEATVSNAGSVEVRKSEQLQVEVNRSVTPRGQAVRFTVKLPGGTPVENSVISIGGQRVRTNANGVATVTLDQEGTYTADVGLEPTASTAYINTTTQVEVEPPGVSVDDVELTSRTIRSDESFGVNVGLTNNDGISRDVDLRVKVRDQFGSVVNDTGGAATLRAGTSATVSPGGLAEIRPGQRGNYTVEVNASVGDTRIASVERDLRVKGVPLMVYERLDVRTATGALIPDGGSVPAGDPINVTVNVTNRGTGAGPYNASLIAGPDLENDRENFRIVTWRNGTLPVKDTATQVSFTTVLPRDADVAVLGWNPGSNAAGPQRVTVDQIEGIDVNSLSVNETNVAYGNDVRVDYVLSNDGSETVFVPLIVDGENVTGVKVASDGAEGSYNVTDPDTGSHSVDLVEASESFVVRGSDLKADVAAPDTVTSERVTVEGVVTNVGSATASKVDARLEIKADDPGADWQTLRSETLTLGSGESATMEETFTRKDWNYSVRVDVDQAATEPDRRLGNNRVVQAINGTPLATGTVQDADGNGLGGTTVLSLKERDAGAYNVTGPNGGFTVPVEYNGGDQGIVYGDTTRPTVTPLTFDRNGVPDIAALGATDGRQELVDLGPVSLSQAHTIDVTVVDQSGSPVGNANVTFVHEANGGNAGFTNYTTADGKFVGGSDGETGIEMPSSGTVKVWVEPPEDQPRFIDQVYTRRFTSLSADKSLTIRLAEGPDLRAEVDADSPQRVRDSPNATITVSNDGLQNVTRSFTVNVTAYGKQYKSDGSVVSKSETYLRTVNSLNGREASDNVTTLDVNLTDFAKRLFPGPKRNGNVRIEAEVDSTERITTEIDRSNNVAVNETLITYSDIEADVSAPSTVVQHKNDTVLAIARNTGTTTSEQHTVDVSFPNGRTVQRTVKPLAPGERRAFSVEHTFTGIGTNDVTVEVTDDDEFPRENSATAAVSVEPMDVTIKRTAAPSNVTNESSFYVETRFTANQTENVSAVADFGDHPALEPVAAESWNDQKAAVNFSASDGTNTVAWNVTASADKDATKRSIRNSIDVSVAAQDEAIRQNTSTASDSASVTTSVDVPTLRIVNTSAGRVAAGGYDNAVEIDVNTVNDTVNGESVQTYNHTLNVTLQSGTEGRSLSGLQYLFHYPYGCVEQTTSQMVTALRVDQYYRNAGKDDYRGRDRANDTIRQGLNKLSDEETVVENRWGYTARSLDQEGNGAWSMWGNDPDGDLFYTMYAFEGTSAVARDPVQSSRTQIRKNLSGINFNNTVTWLAGKQADSGPNAGSFRPSRYFLEDRASATGFVLVSLDRAEPDINSATKPTYDGIRVQGAKYLLEEQDDDGYWGSASAGDRNPRPQATALSVLALMSIQEEVNNSQDNYSKIDRTELSGAIRSGVDWLEGSQNDDGSWAPYESYWGWSPTGEKSRATGYAVLALHEYTGTSYAPNVDGSGPEDRMDEGVDFLLDTYERGGSFGYTAGTSVAVHALTEVGQGSLGSVNVTVYVPQSAEDTTFDNVSKSVTVSGGTQQVQFTDDELSYLRNKDVPIKIKLNNSNLVIAGIESEQLVKQSDYEKARGGS